MDESKVTIHVLLVEDDQGDALLVEEMLAGLKAPRFLVAHVERAAEARERLTASPSFDVLLLDLSLPDGQGLDLVHMMHDVAPEVPVVVMSGLQDEDLALRLVQEGVQDYCVKGHVDGFLLSRALRYAIERKRIEDELRRKNAELAVLLSVSSTVSHSVDMRQLLAEIIDTITSQDILSLEHKGAVFLAEDNHLTVAYEVGHDAGFLQRHHDLALGQCLCGLAATSGQMICAADATRDPRYPLLCADGDAPGHIVVPLVVREQIVGVLCLYTNPNLRLDEPERRMLLSIGEQVAVAIDNVRLYERTKRLALHDPLTGLANRRHLEVVAEGNLAMARRHGTPFALIMLDLDHFKQYNDSHGHGAGDALLVAVAEAMRSEVRETSLVVRYGGEEFQILLPDTEIEAAMTVAERVRQRILERTGATVSIGVAWTKDGSASLTTLIETADRALYLAKSRGRNQVVRGE